MKRVQKAIEKYRNIPVPAKAAVWFLGCNLCIKGISFFSAPLFTRLLSEAEYGKMSIILSYEQLFLIFATWELSLGAYQKGIFKYQNDLPLFTVSLLSICNILTVSLFALIALFHRQISALTGMSGTVLMSMFVYLMLQPAYSCWLIRKRTAYQYKSAVAEAILFCAANVLVSLAGVLLIAPTANIKVICSLLATSSICAVFYVQSMASGGLRHGRGRVRNYWRYSLRYQAPLVLHSLSYFILAQADRTMIGWMAGNEKAAYYSVAYSVASVSTLFQSSVNQTLQPWIYQMLESEQYKKIRYVANVMLCLVGMIALVFVLCAPEVIRFLFTDNYYESIWCIPPVAVSTYFMFLYTLFVNIETYFEKTKYVMYVSVTCAALNIVLNYFGIRMFGYIACGYTTLICYILFALGHYCFMKKTEKNNVVSGERLFDVGLILLISFVIVIASVGITVFYQHPAIRYGIVAVVGVAALMFRDRLMDVVREVRSGAA